MFYMYLHDHPQFKDLLLIVADREGIAPMLVEKDYWIMHVLSCLEQHFDFALKGGTSLSKGHHIIDRFSEDLDLLIEPPADLGFAVNQTSIKDNAVASRKAFYDWLAQHIQFPGLIHTERDYAFDDTRYYRSGGIRLIYPSVTTALPGVKGGILLEAGFSKVAPNVPLSISSWAYDFAVSNTQDAITDNRARAVRCYHPGYTLVEKIQTVIRHYRQEVESGDKQKNFMRQYYDIYSLLDNAEVLAFIGSPEYQAHRAAWITGKDALIPVNEHPALLIEDTQLMADFTARYVATEALYYRGQPDFAVVIRRIREKLPSL
ncbi:nucleotidyl transferase AbiEii/AbiGii toxin family protein [Chitinophaga costaii]|nr:nucleotidyl transferase AbiEii/AbiGii toxin family protein [Chitinophaga costaii]